MVAATIIKTLSFKIILKQDLSTFTNLDVQIVEVISYTYTQIKIINPIWSPQNTLMIKLKCFDV
jgi:hypothetical protein